MGNELLAGFGQEMNLIRRFINWIEKKIVEKYCKDNNMVIVTKTTLTDLKENQYIAFVPTYPHFTINPNCNYMEVPEDEVSTDDARRYFEAIKKLCGDLEKKLIELDDKDFKDIEDELNKKEK